MSFGTRTIRTEGRWAVVIQHLPIVRADLKSAKRIRSVMADDMRGHLAAAGGVTHDDLLLIGWTAAQARDHAQHAVQLARRRAGQDA